MPTIPFHLFEYPVVIFLIISALVLMLSFVMNKVVRVYLILQLYVCMFESWSLIFCVLSHCVLLSISLTYSLTYL